MEDNIENLNFHPQLRYKGTSLFIGKLASLLLIIFSLFYWVTFISGKAGYQLLLGTGILLYGIYFLCLFLLSLYLRNFKLRSVRIWIYLIIVSYIFLFAVTLSNILTEVLLPLTSMYEYEFADNPGNVIVALLALILVLGFVLLLLTGYFVTGIRLMSFKDDFVGRLKPLGILMVCFPALVILSYIMYFVMSILYANGAFFLNAIYSIIVGVYIVTGILLFRIFHKASRYNNAVKEEIV